MELGLDPTLPDVSLVLKGTTYHLCYDFNAIVRAERHSGLNLLRAYYSDLSAENVGILLWAALQHEHPTLTVEHVGSLITLRNLPAIFSAIRAAWEGSLPDSAEGRAEGKDAGQTETL